ncbi:MAG TPA: DUF6798 domain-containing protein [Bryobacteraceae bacterium]|jgi:hypothetical protein
MNRAALAAACAALALLTFFQFPGHTWLQQDTQIYAPILEHQRDFSVLRNDLLVQQSHVAFTLYDETARWLRALTGAGFEYVLGFEQIVTRALGIWGLYLMATAIGLRMGPALAVAAIASLGAAVAGPQVLTLEYEPTPRAFAIPLLVCGIGLAAHRRFLEAGIAGAAAFLYHPPTTLPYWPVLLLAARGQRVRAFAPFAAATAVLLLAAYGQGEDHGFFRQLSVDEERLQRLRAAYVWVSAWPWSVIVRHLVFAGIAAAAYARLRGKIPPALRWFVLGLPAIGLLSLPLSWLLLERLKWAVIPQIQPLRAVLFVTLSMVFLTAAAGARARFWEAAAWFACAYWPTVQPLDWQRVAVWAGLALATAAAREFVWIPALAAFFAIPWLGGVVNYPRLHAPELAQLSQWARTNTPPDSVFLFPDAGHALYPGIFRAEALRAVYVDWKGGGQVNYIRGFGDEWWFRWQQTMTDGINLPKYGALGIGYVVVRPEHRLAGPTAFESASFVVYPVMTLPF